MLRPSLVLFSVIAVRGIRIHPTSGLFQQSEQIATFEFLESEEIAHLDSEVLANLYTPVGAQNTQVYYSLRNHGWGTDLLQFSLALETAWKNNNTMKVVNNDAEGWSYAVGYYKDKDPASDFYTNKQKRQMSWKVRQEELPKAVCPKKDLSCYFEDFPAKSPVNNPTLCDAYLAATVPQPWLQEKVTSLAETVDLPSDKPCAVVHVRRADSVLNTGGWANRSNTKPLFRYVPLEEYFDRARDSLDRQGISEILLLTDSSTVIDDELPKLKSTRDYEKYNFHFVERERFEASEGGWENHFPSGSAVKEVSAIKAEEFLASKCGMWIGTRSSFATMLQCAMPKKHRFITVSNSNP